MFEWFRWFTDFENSKIIALILFFVVFCGIVIYVFTGKQRAKRLESYKNIPFQDERTETDSQSRKVTDNEREED
jgi:cbb3-type cytochrome oxidase subunit 3